MPCPETRCHTLSHPTLASLPTFRSELHMRMHTHTETDAHTTELERRSHTCRTTILLLPTPSFFSHNQPTVPHVCVFLSLGHQQGFVHSVWKSAEIEPLYGRRGLSCFAVGTLVSFFFTGVEILFGVCPTSTIPEVHRHLTNQHLRLDFSPAFDGGQSHKVTMDDRELTKVGPSPTFLCCICSSL